MRCHWEQPQGRCDRSGSCRGCHFHRDPSASHVNMQRSGDHLPLCTSHVAHYSYNAKLPKLLPDLQAAHLCRHGRGREQQGSLQSTSQRPIDERCFQETIGVCSPCFVSKPCGERQMLLMLRPGLRSEAYSTQDSADRPHPTSDACSAQKRARTRTRPLTK